MRSVEFHPEAEVEFIAAARYYEDQTENLGLDFVSAVQGTVQRILEFPESGRLFGRRLRRVLVAGFPYGLLYRVEPRLIFIVAVAHLHRRPGYWRSRR
ncbi:MAG: type II toxin-antitoxin system RelE/ParE family toxin [Deltaproteobacteria bacterium]|nr:type II toxin-antitoxin system RelE/ParE family toxin [Deltaproteobacteria bacterium]